MNNYDPLTKARKWLTDAKNISTEGKYFADAKSMKDLSDVLAHGDNFVGSMSEWNALSTAEKIKYKTADIAVQKYTLTIIIDEGVDDVTLSPVATNNKYIEGTVVTITATAKDGYYIKSGTGTVTMDSNKTVNITSILGLKFSSDDSFTLSVSNPQWDGTLEYSVNNGDTWSTWNGSQLSGTASQPVYLRGSNNTKITGGSSRWTFTGKYCTGNIETLLDYQTVSDGQHPTMANNCYNDMFYECRTLIVAPELPATILTADYCYSGMFMNCSSLIAAPELPATTLAYCCYRYMFLGCTSLTVVPKLPATTLADYCYDYMFCGCTSLTVLPELPATTLTEDCYNYMFGDCTLIKLSTTQTGEYQYPYRIPTNGTGTIATDSLIRMFNDTGGTFTGTPTINTTYYTDHEPIG